MGHRGNVAYQFTRPLVKNLVVPIQKFSQPFCFNWGSSGSPSQQIRTHVCQPPTDSSSNGSSGYLPKSASSSPSLYPRHRPERGRSPTKYTRTPRTSESGAVRSSSAGENVIRSCEERIVIGPRKQRGSERETSP